MEERRSDPYGLKALSKEFPDGSEEHLSLMRASAAVNYQFEEIGPSEAEIVERKSEHEIALLRDEIDRLETAIAWEQEQRDKHFATAESLRAGYAPSEDEIDAAAHSLAIFWPTRKPSMCVIGLPAEDLRQIRHAATNMLVAAARMR